MKGVLLKICMLQNKLVGSSLIFPHGHEKYLSGKVMPLTLMYIGIVPS